MFYIFHMSEYKKRGRKRRPHFTWATVDLPPEMEPILLDRFKEFQLNALENTRTLKDKPRITKTAFIEHIVKFYLEKN